MQTTKFITIVLLELLLLKPALLLAQAVEQSNLEIGVNATNGYVYANIEGEVSFSYGASIRYRISERTFVGFNIQRYISYAGPSTLGTAISKEPISYTHTFSPDIKFNYGDNAVTFGLGLPLTYYKMDSVQFADTLVKSLTATSSLTLGLSGAIGFRLRIYETLYFQPDFYFEKGFILLKKEGNQNTLKGLGGLRLGLNYIL